jgi:hypothetical protein
MSNNRESVAVLCLGAFAASVVVSVVSMASLHEPSQEIQQEPSSVLVSATDCDCADNWFQGQTATDFTLCPVSGATSVHLAELAEKKPVVLIFGSLF